MHLNGTFQQENTNKELILYNKASTNLEITGQVQNRPLWCIKIHFHTGCSVTFTVKHLEKQLP